MTSTSSSVPGSGILRIGILGAAKIAPEAIIEPAASAPRAAVTAVAARDTTRAREFARRHDIPTVHATYNELLADPSIDAVYNPLPNGLHGRWTLAAIAAGKHVLCEKPFTANADEAREVADAARDSGLVVMEAVHYRYHPVADRMVEIARSGELGTLRHVSVAFAAPMPKFSDIRYRLDLAGGALMDPGCYAVHMARTLVGTEPTVTSAQAKLRSPGLERAITADLSFPDGETGEVLASLWSRDLLRLSLRAVFDRGEMRVFNPLVPHKGHRITVRPHHGKRRRERLSRRSSYAYQLDAFTAAVQHKQPFLTDADDAVRNMTVIDEIYREAGLPQRQPA